METHTLRSIISLDSIFLYYNSYSHPCPQASSRYTSARSGRKALNPAREHLLRRIRNQQGRLGTRLGWSKKVLQVLQTILFRTLRTEITLRHP